MFDGIERMDAACPVCGAGEAQIRRDSVERQPHSWLALSECLRCDHRWTAAGSPPPAALGERLVSVGPRRESRRAA